MKKIFTFFVILSLNGLGGFSQLNWSNPAYYPTTTPSTDADGYFLFGDFNNDTKKDMLVRHWPQNSMSLLINNGDGTFDTPLTITSNLFVNTMVIADLNNDSFLDIATTNADGWGNPDLVSIHLGNGDGTFQPMASYSGYGQYKYSLDAGDITGDGFKDLVVTSAGWDGFSVLVNNGDGTFTLGNNYSSTNESSPIKLADFNGDSNLDVVIGNGGWGYGFEIDVFFGNGDGTFNPFVSYPTAEHPQIIICDLDNQNGTDIIVDIPATHASYYFKNDGLGNFTQVLIKENYDVKGLCDWNNDNKIDLVAFGWDATNSVSSGTYVILNNGNDVYSDPLLIDAAFTGYLSQFNNDNLFDFAYIDTAQQAVGVKLQIELINTLDSGLVAHYPFNGNANDESGNGNNGTVNGATLITDRFGNVGKAYNFDGVSNDITINFNAGLLPTGSNNMTYCFWLKSNAVHNNYSSILSNGNHDFSGGAFVIDLPNSDSLVYILHSYWGYGGGNANSYINLGQNIRNNQFHFLVVTVANDNVSAYIDGLYINTDNWGLPVRPFDSNFNIWLGKGYNSGYNYFYNGSLDDIRIYNRALTPAEIQALYTEQNPCNTQQPQANNVTINSGSAATLTATGGTSYNWYSAPTGGIAIATGSIFTTPNLTTTTTFYVSNVDGACESTRDTVVINVVNLTSGLVAHYPFNGNANDESGNGNNGTVNGATLTTDRFGNVGKAYSFDGLTKYIDLTGKPIAGIGNASRSIMAWVKTTDLKNWMRIIATGKSGSYSGINGEAFNLLVNIGYVSFMGYAADFLPQTSYISDDSWHMVGVTYDGSLISLWVDGALKSSGNVTLNTQGNDNYIGKPNDTPGNAGPEYSFNGEIDDIRIYNRALNQQEIDSLYHQNGWPLTVDLTSGLVAHYPFNGNANDESGNGNNGTVFGSASLTADRNGNLNSAYSFDGVDDYITVNNTNVGNFINDGTISFWLYTDNSSFNQQDKFIVSKDNGPYWMFRQGTSDSLYLIVHPVNWSGGTIAGKQNIMNSWHNIIFTKQSENIKIFFDGNLKQDFTGLNSSIINNDPLCMGKSFYWNGYYFKGSLDDIRIYDRALNTAEIQALYTEQNPCNAPQPQANNATINSGSTATLTATGGTSYNWYSAPTGGMALATGTTFTTLNLTVTTTYYVSNNDGLCESTRDTVVVAVQAQSISGEKIFYVARSVANKNTIFRINTDGTSKTQLFDDAWHRTGVRVSVDNELYYLKRQNELYVLGGSIILCKSDVNGQNEIELWTYPNSATLDLRGNIDLRLDKQKIIYSTYELSNRDGDVFELDLTNFTSTNISNNNDYCDVYPSYTHDPSKIVFIELGTPWFGHPWNMFQINTDGTNKVQLTPIGNQSYYCPSFSHDGTKIVYSSNVNLGDPFKLYVANSDGTTGQQITPSTGVSDGIWNPAFSPDDTKLVFYRAPNLVISNINGTVINEFPIEDIGDQFNIQWVNLSPVNLTSGLVAHYPFNGNANDESGNGNNGTVNGATLSTDRFGNVGKAYSFDGVSNYLEVVNQFFNSGWTDYTISGWFSTNDINQSEQAIFNNYPYNVWFGFNHPAVPNKISYYIAANQNATSWDVVYGNGCTSSNFSNQHWYQFTLIKNGNNFNVFLNGQLENQVVGQAIPVTNYSSLMFAKYVLNNQSYFNGSLDDIRIYNRAINQQEIDSLYHEGGWPLQAALTVQQRLDATETPKHIFDSGMPLDSLYGKNYQGGKISFLNASAEAGLIAAPSDQAIVADWGCMGTAINGADGTAIGTGAQNTIDIVSGCLTLGTAAYIADTLTLNGYTDWFLPSRDELNALYLTKDIVGGFTWPYGYWSSSEFDVNQAWGRCIANGGESKYDKLSGGVGSIRCIRSFGQFNNLTVSFSNVINSICSGSATGTATAVASGGTPPYSYTWNTIPPQTSVTVTGLSVGSYIVSVTDATNASVTDTVIISEIPTPTITSTTPNFRCGSGTVALAATVSAGTATWWTAASGGTNLGTGTSFTTPSIGVTTTYYVDATSAGCTSGTRTPVVATVKHNSGKTIPQTACNSFTLNGTTYTVSGTFLQTLVNAIGCDSIIRLNLTIKHSSASTQTQTACGSYALNGTTYTSSGVYTQTLANAEGCDSVITLNLTINNSSASTITQSVCDSYTLNGTTYNASGTYTQTLANTSGCDSVITLNLTVNNSSESSQQKSICAGQTYAINGHNYTTTGMYHDTLFTVMGCDSIVITNLTVISVTLTGLLPEYCSNNQFTVVAGAPEGGAYTGTGITGNVFYPANAQIGNNVIKYIYSTPGCADTAIVNVVVYQTPQLVYTDISNANCGQNNGYIYLDATGGTLPYIFKIDNATTQTLTNLSAGIHTAQVTDNKGCKNMGSFTIQNISGPVVNISGAVNATCEWSCNGHAVANATGNAPFTYHWTNGESGATANELCAGINTVVVTDASGCISSDSVHTGFAAQDGIVFGRISYSGGFINGAYADVKIYSKTHSNHGGFDQRPRIVSVGADGRYFMQGFPNDMYVLKVLLHNHANMYPHLMNTYYAASGPVTKWDQADSVQLSCGDSTEINIVMYESHPGNGHGKINGHLVYYDNQGKSGEQQNGIFISAGKAVGNPVNGGEIYIELEPDDEPISSTETDSTGFYEFQQIPDTMYSLRVEIPGFPLLSTYTFTVSPTDSVFSDFDFYVDTAVHNGFVDTTLTQVPTEKNNYFEVAVYPNPFKEFTEIKYKLNNENKVLLKVFDAAGKEIETLVNANQQTKGEYRYKFESKTYNSGTYFVQLMVGKTVYLKKVVRN